ncbi:MAG: hypothetical protein D3904_04325 [Candidatus Electrothrix sp. EH2]|nr:hypothetical protein [Candidatus Electrothrix sp. EH2]
MVDKKVVILDDVPLFFFGLAGSRPATFLFDRNPLIVYKHIMYIFLAARLFLYRSTGCTIHDKPIHLMKVRMPDIIPNVMELILGGRS